MSTTTATKNGKTHTNGTVAERALPLSPKRVYLHPPIPGGEPRRKFSHEANDRQILETLEKLYSAMDELDNWHTVGHHGPSCCCRLCKRFRAVRFLIDDTILEVESDMIPGREERPIHRSKRS